MESVEQTSERSFELERIIFFSDAVFAIAITLLALELRVPEATTHEPTEATAQVLQGLLAQWPKYLAFFLSFMQVGVYWMAHHRMFRYIVRYDAVLILINLLLLLFIAFLPFAAGVLGQYGDLQIGVIVYALTLTLIGFVATGLWLYASRHHQLLDKFVSPELIRFYTLRGLITPSVAGLVIALSFFNPLLANFCWFLTLPIQFLLLRLLPAPL